MSSYEQSNGPGEIDLSLENSSVTLNIMFLTNLFLATYYKGGGNFKLHFILIAIIQILQILILFSHG